MTTQQPRLLYLLRTFPELSETFVLREIQALRSAGVPVSVLAIAPGAHASMVLDAEGGADRLPPFRYLSRPADLSGLSGRSTSDAAGDNPGGPLETSGARAGSAPAVAPSDEWADAANRGPGARAPGSYGTLAAELARDVASLAGHPRRTARALRLAVYARRGAALVPFGTARLHAHFANDAAALARYVCALTGIPYRVTAHAYDLYQDPFLLGANLAGAERVYTVARASLETLRARADGEGWDASRFSVLRCGIDLAAFPYRDPAPPGRPARILSVARLVPKKGLLTLLDAVARMPPGTHLTIAGDGPQAGEIAARAASPDLAGRVTRLGAVPPPRVRDLMRASDLFVLAARIAEDGDRDGLPVSLIEAMALGLPVLATAVAGIPELVTAETGRLVPAADTENADAADPAEPAHPADDAEALFAAIRIALAEAPQRRVDLARGARRRIELEFDLAAQVAALRP